MFVFNKPHALSKINTPFLPLAGLFALVFWGLFRIYIYAVVISTQIHFVDLAKSILMGLWFDVATIAFIASPMLLIAVFVPNKIRQSIAYARLLWTLLFITVFLLIFELVSEYIFWQEFSTRFNFIAVDYLIYTNEVIGNINESYPITLILLSIAVIAALLVYIVKRKITLDVIALTWRKRVSLIVFAVLLPLMSHFFVNSDQATSVSSNIYAQELSLNGLFSFSAAMRRNDLDYERFYQTIEPKKANEVLSRLKKESQKPLDLFNVLDASSPFIKKPKNIILITVESLSASYLGAYGSPDGITPNLDEVAKNGLMFDRLYATGTRTVRGLEALSLGTPPIPGQAIIRRPGNEHLSTVGEYLEAQGVSTAFIYGGYGYFDNMNAYFKSNDYKIYDRTDFNPKTIVMENVWGVADESLFTNTLNYVDGISQKKNPFFIQVMTTSNHRPYTFPEGRIDLPSGSRKAAVKYTDYAIGNFIEQAKTKSWFNDTLFIIVADHCASVAGKTKLPVDKYHIPMIFYGPKIVRKGNFKSLISQIDIPPTLIEIMGYKGASHFFGDNLFKRKDEHQRAFISNYQSLGYYKNDQLVILLPKQKIETYLINPVTFEAQVAEPNEYLTQEAIAYYQTASIDFKHGLLKEISLD
jgi:phosphoglycerol transferase MdoB-like AlkP superfamily enzyme